VCVCVYVCACMCMCMCLSSYIYVCAEKEKEKERETGSDTEDNNNNNNNNNAVDAQSEVDPAADALDDVRKRLSQMLHLSEVFRKQHTTMLDKIKERQSKFNRETQAFWTTQTQTNAAAPPQQQSHMQLHTPPAPPQNAQSKDNNAQEPVIPLAPPRILADSLLFPTLTLSALHVDFDNPEYWEESLKVKRVVCVCVFMYRVVHMY